LSCLALFFSQSAQSSFNRQSPAQGFRFVVEFKKLAGRFSEQVFVEIWVNVVEKIFFVIEFPEMALQKHQKLQSGCVDGTAPEKSPRIFFPEIHDLKAGFNVLPFDVGGSSKSEFLMPGVFPFQEMKQGKEQTKGADDRNNKRDEAFFVHIRCSPCRNFEGIRLFYINRKDAVSMKFCRRRRNSC